MAEKKRPHLQTAKRNKSVAEQSYKKSSSIGKTASVPHLYYIVPRAKTVLFCTKNTSLNWKSVFSNSFYHTFGSTDIKQGNYF